VLVNLQLQTGLIAHYVFEKRHQKRIRPAAEIRQIHGEQPIVPLDYLRRTQNLLPV
jgi:hypothetical protein